MTVEKAPATRRQVHARNANAACRHLMAAQWSRRIYNAGRSTVSHPLPMKIFAVCSERFRPFRDEWFLPTLPPDMEPIVVDCPFDSVPCQDFRKPQWLAALDFKMRFVCDTIRDHPGQIICFSDLDMQFFGSFKAALVEGLVEHDVTGMRESQGGGMNVGFYAVRCTPQVEALWEEALYADKSEAELHEQSALNALLEDGCYDVKFSLLPDIFWASHRHEYYREPEPSTIVVSHATAVDKFKELRRIRAKYAPRNS